MNKLLAAGAPLELSPKGGFKGFGPLGLPGGASEGFHTFTQFISTAIGVISIVAIIWFVFILLSGGLSFMSSGGDKNSLESAKKKIVNGLVGLLVVVFGIFIIQLIGKLIGIDILNIGNLIIKISQ